MILNEDFGSTSPEHFSARQYAGLIGKPMLRILAISVLMVAIGVLRGLWEQWPLTSVALVLGGILSVTGAFLLGRSLGEREPSARAALSNLAGLLPYVYGVYLCAYEGFWGVIDLLGGFSFSGLLAAVLYLYLGYRIVFWTWQLTEIGEALKAERLIVVE